MTSYAFNCISISIICFMYDEFYVTIIATYLETSIGRRLYYQYIKIKKCKYISIVCKNTKSNTQYKTLISLRTF